VRVRSIEIQGNTIQAVQLESERLACDGVVSTVALPVLDQLVPGQTTAYFEKARQVKYIGVVCMVLNLKYSFSPNFWLNINDPRICFNGIIEQTNLNPNLRAAGLNIIYIPYYLPVSEPRYSFSDQQLYGEYIGMLKLVNPAFDESWIVDRFVSRTAYAQAASFAVAARLMRQILAAGAYTTSMTGFPPLSATWARRACTPGANR